MKHYLLVFNPRAKRYSREGEATIRSQAAHILGGTIAVAYTVPHPESTSGRYTVADFARAVHGADGIVAVGGDGTVNIVVSALAQHGLLTALPLGVIPYGTGNNLLRSFGLASDSAQALRTIQQGQTVGVDVGVVNHQHYCVNVSIGLFAHLLAHRITNSRLGYAYETLRHLNFRPWPLRIRYQDAQGRTIELPSQPYIVGAMLNTSYYGSFLHMAPDAVCDDGLFDVTLIRAVPRLAYPLIFTMILTGHYALSRSALTFRAQQLEFIPETACRAEMDGELLPPQAQYTMRIAGRMRLLVPRSSALRMPQHTSCAHVAHEASGHPDSLPHTLGRPEHGA